MRIDRLGQLGFLSAALFIACGGGATTEPTPAETAPSITAPRTATPRPDPAAAPTPENRGAADRTRQFIAANFPMNDYSLATVALDEIVPVLPRDAISAIDAPQLDSVGEADEWLHPEEPVVLVQLNDEARAYPLQILTWHEIVNDVVGDEPILVSYCPLCNTAIAFRRTLEGTVHDFGVSGALRHNDLIMYDRQTETLWQQITGNAIVGLAAGSQLEFLPAQIVSWVDFRDTFPEGLVLNRDTGRALDYGRNPYPLYDATGSSTLFSSDFDDARLDAKERVLTVDLGDDPIAFPFTALAKHVVLEGRSADQPVVAFWQPGTVSALDEAFIIAGRNVGSAGAFVPELDGAPIDFEVRDGSIVDRGTGSTWNVLGYAIAGPLEGRSLRPVISANHFWFAWAIFEPDTRVIAE